MPDDKLDEIYLAQEIQAALPDVSEERREAVLDLLCRISREEMDRVLASAVSVRRFLE